MDNAVITMVQILMGTLIGFIIGCIAADKALKKKTGQGIQWHLAQGKKGVGL